MPASRVGYVPDAQGGLPPGPTYCTYGVRVPGSGVGYVPRTVAPQVVVHLNFRSEAHLAATCPGYGRGGEGWLATDGWELNTERESTVSTGVPNGPYSGPVFSKAFGAGATVRLMGSNTWEGVYFVFVETQV